MQGLDLGHVFYDHTYGYRCIISFLHFMMHYAWWWLLYAAEIC